VKTARRSTAKRLFRIATLVAPSWLAWYLAFSVRHPGDLARAVTFALGPLWMALTGMLVLRAFEVIVTSRRPENEHASILERIDILTGRGSALAWTSAFAVMGAIKLGWASLAALGLLGTGLFHVVVIYAFFVARGHDPMRARTITRRFTPETVCEGDEMIEELRFAGARIPIGFRLFAEGRVGPRWPTSRHVLSATESGADVALESDVGPALRGEHEPEPLVVWLEDTFGLCRSARVAIEAQPLFVAARQSKIDRQIPLRDHGIGPREPRRTFRLPTEGAFDLREYRQGDDIRRIHWVRSITAGELVVRMPDEIPPDRPRVRVVLDTYFAEAVALGCDATIELLDGLVGVWLAVGRSLAESGARVTMVAAVKNGENVETLRHVLTSRTPQEAARIGARVAWQDRVSTESLLTDEATFVVSRGVVAPPREGDRTRWIVVYPTISEPKWPFPSVLRLPYPMGSAENRWSHRRRIADERAIARTEHSRAMIAMRSGVVAPPPGTIVALPAPDGTIHMETVR
jgi:hypothetical protein